MDLEVLQDACRFYSHTLMSSVSRISGVTCGPL